MPSDFEAVRYQNRLLAGISYSWVHSIRYLVFAGVQLGNG